jgi:dTDP-4-amino-4,6-dideoxygalactose transaminase
MLTRVERQTTPTSVGSGYTKGVAPDQADVWSVPLADVDVSPELVRAASEAVASGWWSMGPRVHEFEQAFAAFSGAKHAIAVASGTAALHLALLALECDAGDEVIVPSLNFVAAANTIVHVGATPVFCDIGGDDDLTADPGDVEQAIGPKTKAIVVMHYGGVPCRMDELRQLAAEHHLAIIEDAAHAPGATYRGVPCGRLGDVGCFSFFANKNLPLGEGGMVTTDRDDLAERIRLLRSHGMTTLTWDRHRGHAHTYDVLAAGFNYRLDEPRAAMGLVQLGRLGAENEARAGVAARYREALHDRAGLLMPFHESSQRETSAHHLAVVLVPEGVDRDAVRGELERERIQTSVHYPPIHQFTYYASPSCRELPRTESVAARLITLPLYGSLSESQVNTVIEALLGALDRVSP